MKRAFAVLSILAFAAALPLAAQTNQPERWLHVRVDCTDPGGEMVRINVPLSLAEKVIPAIHEGPIRDGKITIRDSHMNDVDLRALLAAVRDARDGEFVTVQRRDGEVRVAKQNGFLLVHVRDLHHEKNGRVEVRVPMTVVNALVSSGSDQLDLAAGIRALAASGDTELVTVKDDHDTVHVWVDSKNTSE